MTFNDMNNSSFIELKTIFMELLNKVTPLKLIIYELIIPNL